MRRVILLFLICLLCINIASCSNKTAPKIREPVKFYYRNATLSYNKESGVISPEIREASEHKHDYEYLINMYLQGPNSSLHHRTFPAGTSLLHLEIEGNTVKISLSKEFFTLSGHELSIACAALTRTMEEITGVTTVVILISDGKLGSTNILTFSTDNLLYLDDYNSFIISD